MARCKLRNNRLQALWRCLGCVGARPKPGSKSCGPRKGTRRQSPPELVRRLGSAAVTAVDPSEQFVRAARERLPGVNVVLASAEHLPFPEGSFDAVLAQLVVHFMTDAVAGLTEMARVTRSGGVVAASVWDHAGGQGPLSAFWEAARALDPEVADESDLAGAREGHLEELFEGAGLQKIEATILWVSIEQPTFQEWWEPFMLGVGLAGSYTAGPEPDRRRQLRDLCHERFPNEPLVVTARAWAARGLA